MMEDKSDQGEGEREGGGLTHRHKRSNKTLMQIKTKRHEADQTDWHTAEHNLMENFQNRTNPLHCRQSFDFLELQ